MPTAPFVPVPGRQALHLKSGRPGAPPRHFLVIYPGESPRERDWVVEHGLGCPIEFSYERFGPAVVKYRCDVADEVNHSGLDCLEADEYGNEWATLPGGRYEIEAWHTAYDGGFDPVECESGLRVVRRVGEIVAVAISV